MDPNKTSHHSSLYLLELMITILLFSVNSAVCIRVFSEAHQASQQARLLTEASGACSNVAEVLRASDSWEDAEQQLKTQFIYRENQQGLLCIPQESGGEIQVRRDLRQEMGRTRIAYMDPQGACVYELELTKYYPEVAP